MNEFIPWAKPDYWGSEVEYVNRALKSTWISGGEFVDRLEKEFAQYCNAPRALTASNGTTAIHMAFLGLQLKPGDEVVVPGFCFLAAANVALHMGARPVFAEVDPATWCVTAASIERCLTPKTKIIVAVHTYGNVCEMDEINQLAERRGIYVVEDAAESFASKYKGRESGTLSTIGTFSFQATKTITTGEGGMVVTGNTEYLDRMALYRSHGMLKKRYWHELPGHNFRLTNIQAALGCAQLEKIDVIIQHRRQMHDHYRRHLANLDGVCLQHFPTSVNPCLWAIGIKLDSKAFPQGRDRVMEQMQETKIETRPGFYAASQLDIYETPAIPVCEDISKQVVSLPSFPTLKEEQIEHICSVLRSLRK
jgi:perosamine synthetase